MKLTGEEKGEEERGDVAAETHPLKKILDGVSLFSCRFGSRDEDDFITRIFSYSSERKIVENTKI